MSSEVSVLGLWIFLSVAVGEDDREMFGREMMTARPEISSGSWRAELAQLNERLAEALDGEKA